MIATDAGREGELVARWILEYAKIKKPVKRLWISSVTDKAIKQGFARLQPGDSFLPLYRSAIARAEADWVVGINATRALTTKYNAQLSCGRVQTPTVAIIDTREKEIQTFKPADYYNIKAQTNLGSFTWNNGPVYEKEKAEKLVAVLKNKKWKFLL
ncbi:DNA topoisomerase 3 [Listeria grayi]|uniref:Omega-protein n=1 Tax=Listeria grayi TaxID=1641 RepID=A0A378ME64_LISGR|nr:DNA topoisomerase 3 [Listeria grayi]